MDCTFVDERVLWDCQYLQSLKTIEWLPEFYLTIFCQIPLLLLDPTGCGGGLRHFVEGIEPTTLGGLLAIAIRHRCGNPGCRPSQSWEERQAVLQERKRVAVQR